METSGGYGNGRLSRMTGLTCVSLFFFLFLLLSGRTINLHQPSEHFFEVTSTMSTDSGLCSEQADKGQDISL